MLSAAINGMTHDLRELPVSTPHDPIAQLNDDLARDGKPTLYWTIQHTVDGRDPVSVAWERSRDADAMIELLYAQPGADAARRWADAQRADEAVALPPGTRVTSYPDIYSDGDTTVLRFDALVGRQRRVCSLTLSNHDVSTRRNPIDAFRETIARASRLLMAPERAEAIRAVVPDAPVTLSELLARVDHTLKHVETP